MQWIIDHARHLLLICAEACEGHGGCVGSTEAGSTCRIGCNDGSLFEVPAV